MKSALRDVYGIHECYLLSRKGSAKSRGKKTRLTASDFCSKIEHLPRGSDDDPGRKNPVFRRGVRDEPAADGDPPVRLGGTGRVQRISQRFRSRGDPGVAFLF